MLSENFSLQVDHSECADVLDKFFPAPPKLSKAARTRNGDEKKPTEVDSLVAKVKDHPLALLVP